MGQVRTGSRVAVGGGEELGKGTGHFSWSPSEVAVTARRGQEGSQFEPGTQKRGGMCTQDFLLTDRVRSSGNGCPPEMESVRGRKEGRGHQGPVLTTGQHPPRHGAQ